MAVKAKTAHTSGQAAKRAGFKIIVNLHYQLETATTTCTLRPRQCNRTLGNRSWWLKKKIMSVPTRMWAPSMLDGTFSQVLDPTNPSSTDPLIFGCFLPSMRWISPSQQPARIAVRTSRNRWVFGASNSELVGCVTWDPQKMEPKHPFRKPLEDLACLGLL